EHPGFHMSAREHVDHMIEVSGLDAEMLATEGWVDCQPPFREAHYLDGFAHADGRFHFAPQWTAIPAPNVGPMGPVATMPKFPDQWDAIELPTHAEPYRLVTAPARSFLNSTFNETPGSRAREGVPRVMIHPDDAAKEGIADGAPVVLANIRGRVELLAQVFDGVQPGTLVAEGLFSNEAFAGGRGINTLTGADPVAPYGGAAFHDNRVSIKPAAAG
ncbi:MAG: molybdopterin dinucleotide binding domain-containing protein, partial [Pseudomonadota bacterium]